MKRKLVRTPIIPVQLATPECPAEPLLGDKSWMLSGASSHFDLSGHFFAAEGLRKDASLGVLFSDVPTPSDGRFQLELGTALPDLFPNVNGHPEFCLDVKTDESERPVCFSNVMARLRYDREGQPMHVLLARRDLPIIRSGKVEWIPTHASVELLRTFATCQFTIEGTSAEEAFETNCESCMHDMIERLNRVLKTMPFVDITPGRVYSMAYSRASLPSFYFIIKGASEDKLGHGWISMHVGRSSWNPSDLSADQSRRLSDFLTGVTTPDEVDAILHSAHSYVDAGISEYVLLLSVIAAEVATQRFVHKKLLQSQVSNSKLDESEKDLTYSMMLNIILFAVTDDDNKPDKELIGKMNRARSLRNAYMHTGEVPQNKDEIVELFQLTKKYVEFLRSANSRDDSSAAPQ